MNDLISRQTAIANINKAIPEWSEDKEIAIDCLKNTPSLTQMGQELNPTYMDCVSRQAAIDALAENRPDVWTDDDYELGMKNQHESDIATINALSSAQPEITDEQAIEHLRSTGWMQNHDREMYDMGLKEQLADDSGSYDSLLPSAQPESITCIDCIHYTPLGKDKAWGRCSVHSSPTENQRMCQSCDFCAWAERRTDETD